MFTSDDLTYPRRYGRPVRLPDGAFFDASASSFPWLTGILVGALAGYLASRFMGTQTSFLAAMSFMGVLGSFVGEFLFGMFRIYATGSFSSFVISVVGACVCIWIDNKLFH